jgi:hypothetical protein
MPELPNAQPKRPNTEGRRPVSPNIQGRLKVIPKAEGRNTEVYQLLKAEALPEVEPASRRPEYTTAPNTEAPNVEYRKAEGQGCRASKAEATEGHLPKRPETATGGIEPEYRLPSATGAAEYRVEGHLPKGRITTGLSKYAQANIPDTELPRALSSYRLKAEGQVLAPKFRHTEGLNGRMNVRALPVRQAARIRQPSRWPNYRSTGLKVRMPMADVEGQSAEYRYRFTRATGIPNVFISPECTKVRASFTEFLPIPMSTLKVMPNSADRRSRRSALKYHAGRRLEGRCLQLLAEADVRLPK